MDFYEINLLIKSAPEFFHWVATAAVISMLAHLAMAYKMVRPRLRASLRFFLFTSYLVVLFLFFGKLSHPGYTMLDIFLPLYFIYYILCVIVLQARFFNCVRDGKLHLFEFNSIKKTTHEKT
jgi:hypothetical protein